VSARPLTLKRIQSYRKKTFRLAKPIKTKAQAVDFVSERGFVYFWPISGITLPSLWAAVAGDRPVADAHDDPGHVTWGWKDSALSERVWYYAKVLRKKATMIALDVTPYFYALSENYGDPANDYLILHEQGLLTHEAKAVYEVLLRKGATDSVSLRKDARLNEARFNKAIEELQADFKILPVGVAKAGAWKYAFVYDLVTNHFPKLAEAARPISHRGARHKLAELYFRSVGVARLRDVTRLFGWKPADAEKAVADLAEAGAVRRGLTVDSQPGEWIAVAELI